MADRGDLRARKCGDLLSEKQLGALSPHRLGHRTIPLPDRAGYYSDEDHSGDLDEFE
jgi:hypothetical protein